MTYWKCIHPTLEGLITYGKIYEALDQKVSGFGHEINIICDDGIPDWLFTSHWFEQVSMINPDEDYDESDYRDTDV